MMADLPPVYLEFKAKFNELQTSLKAIEGSLMDVAKTSADTSQQVKDMGVEMIAVGTAVGNALSAMASKVIGFVQASFTKLTGVVGEVKKLSRVMGGSTESVSRFRAAGEMLGISTDNLMKSVRTLSGHLTVNDKAARALGISYRDGSGKLLPMDQILARIADKFKTVPDGAEKTAMAVKLFGRAGTDMLPVLNKGSAGLQELYDKADNLGLSLSGEDAEAVKSYTMVQKDWQATVASLQMAIGRKLLPVLKTMSEYVRKVLIPAVSSLIAGFTGKGGLAPSIGKTHQGMFEIGKAIKGLVGMVYTLRHALIITGAAMIAMWTFNKVAAAAEFIIKIFKAVINVIKIMREQSVKAAIAMALASGGRSLIAGAAGALAAVGVFMGAVTLAEKAMGDMEDLADTEIPPMPTIEEPTGAFDFEDTEKKPKKDPIADYIQWLKDQVSLHSAEFDDIRARFQNMTLGMQREAITKYLQSANALVVKARAEEIAMRNTKYHSSAVQALVAAMKEQTKMQKEMNRLNKEANDIAARQNALLETGRNLSYLAFAAKAENLTYVHEPSVTVPVTIDGREVFKAVQRQALLTERRNASNGLSLSGSVV